jgi:predicted nucleic acid-binding Zn ribbon protein
LEVQHGINDPAPTTCENCGGELRRVFYPPGLVFKGTGFYSTEGRFGRTLDKRETYKKDEAKAEGGGGSKEPAPAASSTSSDAKSSGSKSSDQSASAEKSA